MVIDETITPARISAQLDAVDATVLGTLDDLGKRRGKDLLGQLFQIFVEQGPETFANMRRAVELANPNDLASSAHSLKGSYQSLGLPRLAKICTELESRGRAGQLSGLDVWLDHLEHEFDATRIALREYVEGRSE